MAQRLLQRNLGSTSGTPVYSIDFGASFDIFSGIFDKVDHVIFVGSGGAVPDYNDYQSHVRLADIVVSCPSAKKQPPPSQSSTSGGSGSTDAPTYIHCEKVQQKQNGKCEYETRFFDCKDDTLLACVSQMRSLSEGGSFGRLTPLGEVHRTGPDGVKCRGVKFQQAVVEEGQTIRVD